LMDIGIGAIACVALLRGLQNKVAPKSSTGRIAIFKPKPDDNK
jgi:hypothetical protein